MCIRDSLYGFGHGLSYTSFEFDNIQGNDTLQSDAILQCSVELSNSGQLAGEEAVSYTHLFVVWLWRSWKKIG